MRKRTIDWLNFAYWTVASIFILGVLSICLISISPTSSTKTVYVDRPAPTTTTTVPRTTTTTQPVAITTTCEKSSSGAPFRVIRQGSHIVSIIENAKECP